MKRFLFCLFCVFTFASLAVQAEEDNTFLICDNSLEMVEWDLKFIERASHSIEIAACYAGGTIIQKVLKAIQQRLEVCPDLQVYLLTTPILFEEEDKLLLSKLQNTYKNRIHVEHACSVLILWPDVSGVDNHVKMLVVDETYFSCGGTNLDHFCCEGTSTPENKCHPMGASFPAGSRDQDVVGKGPLAKTLRHEFYKHFALWEEYNKTQYLEKNPDSFIKKSRYFSLEGFEKPIVSEFDQCPFLVNVLPHEVKMLIGGTHQKENLVTQEYIRLIKEAKEEILIANLYFSPADSLFQALMDASNRGVRIVIATNGVNDRSPEYTKFFCWANRISYVPVLYGKTFHLWESSQCKKRPINNVKIYEYYVGDVLLHKKVMIVDGKKFVIGSYNLGKKSDLADYELVLSFNSEKVGFEAKKVFAKDIAHCLEITPKEARDWYFDPFVSYLGEVQRKFHGLL